MSKQEFQRPLTDEELLLEADKACTELEMMLIDNNTITDEEDFEEDEEDDLDDTSEYVPTLEETEDVSDIEMEETDISEVEIEDTVIRDEDRKWRKRDFFVDLPAYNYEEGPVQEHFSMCNNATDVFLVFIDPILEDLIYQSNLYATQRNRTLNLKKELLTFIGINQFMGYHKLPSWRDYWSNSPDLGIPLISNIMSRDRFDKILSNLHINDNSKLTPENRDKLFKLRPMIEKLNIAFETYYRGTRALSVDESMIAFKGRSSIKQYNPMKPIKRGYKLWAIADQKGYMLRFEIYQGKSVSVDDEFKDCGLGERVVLRLTKKEWGKHRIIYFDNFFCSVPLIEKLKVEGTMACGTVRSNKKFLPKHLKADKDFRRGDYEYRFSSLDIGFFKWRDNKMVNFLSNFHGNQTTSVKRTQKNGSSLDIPCPTIVADYNSHMGGVDHADRLRVCYGLARRSKKWWHKIFWGLLDITFVNAYVVYCQLFQKISLLEFRRNVALGLLTYKNFRANRSSSAAEKEESPVVRRLRKEEKPGTRCQMM